MNLYIVDGKCTTFGFHQILFELKPLPSPFIMFQKSILFTLRVLTLAFLVAGAFPALAQSPKFGPELKLPKLYSVLSSAVIGDKYYVHRNIEQDGANVNPSGKSEAGYAVFKDKKDYKDNLISGFVDVYDANTLALKNSFPIVTTQFGAHTIEDLYLTPKGALLLLASEEFKGSDGKKGYNLTLRSMSYDGAISADSFLIERFTKDFYDQYAYSSHSVNLSTGDYYSYKVAEAKKKGPAAKDQITFQKFNVFAKQQYKPITAQIHAGAFGIRVQHLSGKPYLYYYQDEVTSTVVAIREGMNVDADGTHLPNYGAYMLSELQNASGESQYLLNISKEDKKVLKVEAYKLAFAGEKLTATPIISTGLSKDEDDVKNFINADGGLNMNIDGFSEGPEGPAFLVGKVKKSSDPRIPTVDRTSGFIIQATKNVAAPKVTYHSYVTSVITSKAHKSRLVMKDAKFKPNGSYSEPRLALSFGVSEDKAFTAGEPILSYDLRTLPGDKYQLLRPMSNPNKKLELATFTGRKPKAIFGSVNSVLLTLDSNGKVDGKNSMAFKDPSGGSLNVLSNSIAPMASGQKVALIQNLKHAKLMAF